jgi:hypothetical protein
LVLVEDFVVVVAEAEFSDLAAVEDLMEDCYPSEQCQVESPPHQVYDVGIQDSFLALVEDFAVEVAEAGSSDLAAAEDLMEACYPAPMPAPSRTLLSSRCLRRMHPPHPQPLRFDLQRSPPEIFDVS